MTGRMRDAGLVVIACSLLAALIGAGELDQIRELALKLTDRTPIEQSAAEFAELQALIDESDHAALSAAAKRHAKQRVADLGKANARAGDGFSIYPDLMRYPQANQGFAVTVRGRVDRVEELAGEPAGRLVWINPHGEPEGQIAVLLPSDADAPQPDATVEATGIFAKRIVVAPKGLVAQQDAELVAPIVVAPHWQTLDAPGTGDDPSWNIVRDRTLGVRPGESPLYYNVLAEAAKIDQAVIREQARQFEARRRQANPNWIRDGAYWMFADLIEKPEECRGEAITLTGYAREIRSYPAGENAAGIETLYEIWMFTENSQSNPAVIVASEVPAGLPSGDDLQTRIRVTGYFFKLYGYHAASKTRIAPMLLAGPVEMLPEPNMEGFPWWMIALLGGGALLAVGWIILSFRAERHRIQKPDAESPPDFSNME